MNAITALLPLYISILTPAALSGPDMAGPAGVCATNPPPSIMFRIRDVALGEVREEHGSLKVDADAMDAGPVKVSRQSFPDSASSIYSGRYVNTGSGPVTVDEVVLLSLPLTHGVANLTAHYGLERTRRAEGSPLWFQPHSADLSGGGEVDFTSHRWGPAAWLMLHSEELGIGLALGWLTYAPVQCEVGMEKDVRLTLRPGVRLEPGETFEAPEVISMPVTGDMDEACFQAQRFVEKRIAWPVPDERFPYLMFNTWGYERAVDETITRQAIERCAQLGVEVMVVDFGWDDAEWRPKKDAFPNGLAPLSDFCHEKGMRFGFHLSFGNLSSESSLYKEHPERAFGEGCWAYGYPEIPVHAVSLGAPEVRDWAVKHTLEIIDREKVDWFLTDSHLWGHMDPVRHTINGDQEYLAATGFEKVMGEIHEQRPGVLIEHCDGGLSLGNYLMTRQHVTGITCDNANALDTRLSAYDLSYFLPPRYLDKYQQEWRSHYANRSCMFGGPWILMTPIHTLEPGGREWEELTSDIALYKQYRARIRDGKVLHLLRPSTLDDPAWDGWDAIGSYHPGEDAAIVFAFRAKGSNPTRTIPMKALRPDGRYKVGYTDYGKEYEASGVDILRDGFSLTLASHEDNPNNPCSEVIIIEPLQQAAWMDSPRDVMDGIIHTG